MPKRHVVSQGDTLLSIAFDHDVLDWKRIWEHADNQALRESGRHPQVLLAGDVVTIPDDVHKEVTVPSGRKQRFVLKKLPCYFTVYLKDECGQPYANLKYKLKLGGQTFEGQTGADGLVSHPAAPDLRSGELTLWRSAGDPDDTMTWKLDVGALNPIEALTGVKARLRNLGYKVGLMDDHLDGVTRAAIRSFRMHAGLDSSRDDIDESFRNALLDLQNKL